LTMPASVFSRSTECHNQDKVSMGTIAARDCMRVLQLTEQVAAAALLASCQGLELRLKNNEIHNDDVSNKITDLLAEVRTISPFVTEDRALDSELRNMIDGIQNKSWDLYSD